MGRVVKASERPRDRRDRPPGQSEVAELVAAQTAAARIGRQARSQVIELALDVARRIIGQAIELDPKTLDAIYEQALAATPKQRPAKIAIHPEDRSLSKVEQLAAAGGFEVVNDPTVGRAGCRIWAGGAVIDATLEAALGALAAAMKGAYCE